MRILIADDDPLSADLLRAHCLRIDPATEVVHALHGAQTQNLIRSGRWDLLLLDLNMPKVDGRTLLETIGERLPVIIVTGDPAFALDAYRFHVHDYLVKPVTFERFASAWRALDRKAPKPSGGANNIVFVRSGSDIVQVDLDEVRYVKSESNYVRFVLDGRDVLSLMNMKDLGGKLPGAFVRVHRSYFVNLRHVEKLDTNDIKVGRDLIPVSETYRQSLIAQLALL